MTNPLASKNESETPLTEEEREGLIPSYITLRSELNEAEQANIVEAHAWAARRKRDILNEKFLDNLHGRMYGNGRHARLATDLLLIAIGPQPFSWGSASLVDEGQVRSNYISALRKADRDDIVSLLEFVRS